MRKCVRESSLGLFFGAIFLASLIGQALSGWWQFNDDQVAENLARIGLLDYLTSASFAVDVAENWQREFLQFLLYIVATVWLLQRGSPESKELHKAGLEGDGEQKVGRYASPDSPDGPRSEAAPCALLLVTGHRHGSDLPCLLVRPVLG